MYRYSCMSLCCALLMQFPAHAAETAGQPAASASGSPVPQTRYDTVFARYLPFHRQDVAPWRELNDAIAGTGIPGDAIDHAPDQRAAPAPHPPEHGK